MTCAVRVPLLVLLPLSALVGPSAADAQARQQSTVLMPEGEGQRRFQEQWGFSDAIITGDTIYLSGIVVGQREGETLEAAYERAYARIGAILRRAGASWDDVVDITSYHTDVTTQMPAIVAVHRRHVRPPFPAWTAIDVDRLIPDRGITEIKIVARRPAAGGASQLGQEQDPMWRNYMTVGLRALAKNHTYAFINIVGLAIGLAACLMLLIYVRYETSYDEWLPNAANTYQFQSHFRSKQTGEEKHLQMTPYHRRASG